MIGALDREDWRELGYHGPKDRDRRLAPTATALRALANGPKTNAEIQDVICNDSSAVTRIMANQRARGNVTSTATGKGSIATYALTEEGRQAIIEKRRK